MEYCKTTYFREGFNFVNSQKVSTAKIKFLYYIHIQFHIPGKLRPSRKCKNEALAKFDIRENKLLYSA